MMVINGCRRMQGDQGIAYVGQRFVQILDRPLQAIIRCKQGRQLTSEEGDGLAACAEEQPTQQRSKDEKAVQCQMGEVTQCSHQGGQGGHYAG